MKRVLLLTILLGRRNNISPELGMRILAELQQLMRLHEQQTAAAEATRPANSLSAKTALASEWSTMWRTSLASSEW